MAAAVRGGGKKTAAAITGEQTARYRALAPCRVGSFREPGEEFSWTRFATIPAYLEEVTVPRAETGTAKDRPEDAPGATLAEIFVGR